MASLIRWVYYAPNTYKQLKVAEYTKARKPLPAGLDPFAALTLTKLLFKFDRHVCGLFTRAEFLQRVSLPVLLLKFVLLPAPLLLLPGSLGRQCFGRALLHLALADVLTNLHAFVTIVTNHCGNDLYRPGERTPP